MNVKEIKTLLEDIPDDFEVDIQIGSFLLQKYISIVGLIDVGYSDKIVRLGGENKL